MTAKEYLHEPKLIKLQIQNLLRAKNEIENAQAFIKSMCRNPEFKAYSVKWGKMSASLDKEVNELRRQRADIIEKINSLADNRYKDLLIKKYVEFKTIDEVAEDMGYSCEYLMRLHWNAIKEFEAVIS